MRGLSSRLTRVLGLTGLNRPWGSLRPNLATCTGVPVSGHHLLLLSWTGTSWWSRVVNDSERTKEANIPWVTQPASALQEIGQKERERERKKDTGTKALMEQRCFNQHGVGTYTVLQGGYSQQRQRLKFQTYKT